MADDGAPPRTVTANGSPEPGRTADLFEPLDLSSLSDEVAHRILMAIRHGLLVEGEKLPPERRLAEQFAVGRAVVRDGLRRLVDANVLRPLPGTRVGGMVVADEIVPGDLIKPLRSPTQDEMPPLFAMRRLVEPRIVVRAAQNATAGQLAALSRAVELSRAASEAATLPLTDRIKQQLNIANIRFTHTIASATGNRAVVRLINAMNDCFEELRFQSLSDPADAYIATRALADTLDAIQSGSPAMISAVLEKRLTILEATWERLSGQRLELH